MKIIDLNEENKALYFVCLEDWSDEMKEAGNHKECWYNKMNDNGLRVKLALDENNVVGGMIQYIPIEYSFAEGNDLYFINCIWVHGYKKGRGDFRKKGMGKALLDAAEKDVKEIGAKGMVAWGMALPIWMKAAWYKKQGYKKVDKQSMLVLLWKTFEDNAIPPKWIKPVQKKKPEIRSGKINLTALKNGWCPGQNIVYERAKRIAEELGDKVVFEEIDTFGKDKIREWGLYDALFLQKKRIGSGPPLSYKKIKRKVEKKLKRL
ncbi:GNAT family N-acetyltransferase [Bacteroidota bacterium]